MMFQSNQVHAQICCLYYLAYIAYLQFHVHFLLSYLLSCMQKMRIYVLIFAQHNFFNSYYRIRLFTF